MAVTTKLCGGTPVLSGTQVGVKFWSLKDSKLPVIGQRPSHLDSHRQGALLPREVSLHCPKAASASPRGTQSARAPTGGAGEPPAEILGGAQAVGRGL